MDQYFFSLFSCVKYFVQESWRGWPAGNVFDISDTDSNALCELIQFLYRWKKFLSNSHRMMSLWGEGGKQQKKEKKKLILIWMTLRSITSPSHSMSWWCGLCWWSVRRWPSSFGSTGRRLWLKRWWPASSAKPWPTKRQKMTWWMIFPKSWTIIPGWFSFMYAFLAHTNKKINK